MRTKASVVFGRYGTRPLELHGDWYTQVSLYARLLGMELIAHCKDPADLRIPVGKDWRETLCGKLAISGTDRRQARAAMDALQRAGFLHHEGGFARVSLEPDLQAACTTSAQPVLNLGAPAAHGRNTVGSTAEQQATEVPENTQVATASRKVSKIAEEEERANPPTAALYLDTNPLATMAARGHVRLQQVDVALAVSHFGRWQAAYAEIGAKPAGEWAKVVETLRSELAAGNRSMLTPQHIVDYWPRYLAGNPPRRQLRLAKATSDSHEIAPSPYREFREDAR